MEPRATIRTLRLWSSQTGWVEPGSARAAFHTSNAAVVVCPPHDLRFAQRARDTYLGADFNRVEAGAIRLPGDACTGAGTSIW